MLSIKSIKTSAILTMVFFIFFTLSSDFSFSNDKDPQEQKESGSVSDTDDIPINKPLVKSETKVKVSENVIEKLGHKNKKKKKFPWLLVIGGTVVIGVVLYFVLKKKKNNDSEGIDSIKIESSPSGADIWLDGTKTGETTNTTLKNISPGAHTIRLVKAGYWDMQKVVQVEADKIVSINETLIPTTVEWIHIPEGEFIMGYEYVSNSDILKYNINDSKPYMEPPHPVYLDGYYISKYEVTFEEYDKFCDETGHRRSSDFGWGRGTMPAVDISYDDAVAYSQWISAKTGMNIHIPTEAQWEKAARGTDERMLPWDAGMFPDFEHANYFTHIGRTVPVGSYPRGVSPYGVHDMGGNVTEWCQDWFGWDYYKETPYNNPQGPSTGTDRVRRGGDWRSHPNLLLTTWRLYNYPFKPYRLGLRIVMEVE